MKVIKLYKCAKYLAPLLKKCQNWRFEFLKHVFLRISIFTFPRKETQREKSDRGKRKRERERERRKKALLFTLDPPLREKKKSLTFYP